VGPSSQRQCRAMPCPDWLPWGALCGHACRGLNASRLPLSRPLASPLAPRRDRRCPKPPSPGLNCATDADVHVAVPPDATVYTVVPHRRPRAGEPCHTFPGPLPCAGGGAIVRQAWTGRAGPRALCRPRASTRRTHVAVGRACAVHMGRADAASVGQAPLCNWVERGFGPVTLELVFLFSDYIQILANLKMCVGFI
jgi:hypothetical protein